jgi:hypothetical protein
VACVAATKVSWFLKPCSNLDFCEVRVGLIPNIGNCQIDDSDNLTTNLVRGYKLTIVNWVVPMFLLSVIETSTVWIGILEC